MGLTGCGGPWTHELALTVDEETVAVGDTVTVTVTGSLDLPPGNAAELSLWLLDSEQPDDAWVDTMRFEGLSAVPDSGVFLADEAIGDRSPVARFDSVDERPQDVTVAWALTCGAPGAYSVWGEVWYDDGGERVPSEAELPTGVLTCE
jgi:hypothetical protein